MKRKKTFPKKPLSLTSITAKMLGKNSNLAGYQASKKAIYYNQPKLEDTLSDKQKRELQALKRNLKKQIA